MDCLITGLLVALALPVILVFFAIAKLPDDYQIPGDNLHGGTRPAPPPTAPPPPPPPPRAA